MVRVIEFALLLVGVILLAIWLVIVRIIDFAGDLAGRNKRCDKTPAERRPRRAF